MKRALSLAVLLVLLLAAAPVALADEVDGGTNTVTFTADAKMETDYADVGEDGGNATNYKNVSQALAGRMQPGDTATITMTMTNQYAASTDWYLNNEIIQTLEKTVGTTVAEGGAYTYRLAYEGPGGSANSRVLFDSNRVGGENGLTGTDREGLETATEGLEDWLYVDSLGSGQQGRLVLRLALDGESQGNDYQDTLAKLTMQFAVELTPTTTTERNIRHERVTTTVRHLPRTGDESQVLLWSLAALASGLLALVLAVWCLRKDRRDRG